MFCFIHRIYHLYHLIRKDRYKKTLDNPLRWKEILDFVFSFNQEIEHGAVSILNYPRNFYRDKKDDRRKQGWSTELRSHIRQEKKVHSETMARKISAIHEKKTQSGHHRINTGNRKNTNRLVWKRSWSSRRFYMYRLGWSRSIILDDTSGIQNRTQQNSCERPYPTIQRIFSTKTEHLSQPRRILLDRTNRIQNTGRLLAETEIEKDVHSKE